MDQKNLIFAIALSLAILLGWQMLIEQPRQEQAEAELQRIEEAAGRDPNTIGIPAVPAPGQSALSAAPAQPRERDDVLVESRRIAIETASYRGSINLTGGRFDDLTLRNYRQTVEAGSENITLLSPRGTANPYFAEFGWLTGNGTVTGGGKTLWSTRQNKLTTEKPLVLTARTDDGLILTRTIAVDAKYMFTVTDSIKNGSNASVNVSSFGRVTRVNTPDTRGFFILHEGPHWGA